MFDAARQTLDEGQAYISIPTQQKVLEKVQVFVLLQPLAIGVGCLVIMCHQHESDLNNSFN